MMIKGAIFDMDGTLIDSLMFWDQYWEKLGLTFLGKSGFRPCDEIDKNIRTMTLSDAMVYANSACRLHLDDAVLVRFAEDSLADFYKNQAKPKAGVIELLEYLTKQNVKMCIASATAPKYVQLAVEYCGLSKYLQTIVSCVDVGKGKEHPDVYLKALEILGTSVEDTWVFEDSFVALETAKSLGLHTVGVYDPHSYGQDRLRAASRIYIEKDFNILLP